MSAIEPNYAPAPVQGGIVPIGGIVPFAGSKAIIPMGWLLCDGSLVARTQYPLLFSVIGEIYGSGDGETTFNLPDYRGMFLRGVDDGSDQDPDASLRVAQWSSETIIGGSVGSRQADEYAAHTHAYTESQYVGKGNGNWSGSYWNNGSANTGAAGGRETRPKNVYVNYLIRAL